MTYQAKVLNATIKITKLGKDDFVEMDSALGIVRADDFYYIAQVTSNTNKEFHYSDEGDTPANAALNACKKFGKMAAFEDCYRNQF